jgi:adenylate cyclase
MTIRLKIVSIAVALLIVFGIVVGVSAILQHEVTNDVSGITRYHEPLVAVIGDFDVITYEYELLPLRRLRLDKLDQSEPDDALARERAIAQRMRDDIGTASSLIALAAADRHLSIESRLVFARLQGVVAPLYQQLPPFVALGQQVMQAIVDGRLDDARRLSLDFRSYERIFGAETAEVRNAATKLSNAATAEVLLKQAQIRNLSFGLFVVAACLGLGIGIFIAAAVIRRLRRLVDATKAVEAGELSVAVPVQTRDEIGQLATAFNSMVSELRSKERIKDMFGKFVDPRIVSSLIGDPELIARPGRHVVTIFFSDIKGFTPISEQLTAGSMVNLLNRYFEAVTKSIRDTNGIVDKYIGDAVMAFWAPPFSPGDTHAAACCFSALAQQQAIEDLRSDLANITGLRRNTPELFVRMGIATGEAIVGAIGSPLSKSFTVIGDTVNLASRLEGINKVYGTQAIIADDTLRLAQQEIETRELDLISVAGKSEPVRIHELLAPFGKLATAQVELRCEYAIGLEAYRGREWDRAEAQFEKCLKITPTDGPAAVFIERVRAMRATPPPTDWDGVWRITAK